MRSAGGERRWPDSRSVFRKLMALNGTRCRPLYEERNARIFILANGTAERPDTFVQTDQPITTNHLPTGRAIRYLRMRSGALSPPNCRSGFALAGLRPMPEY